MREDFKIIEPDLDSMPEIEQIIGNDTADLREMVLALEQRVLRLESQQNETIS